MKLTKKEAKQVCDEFNLGELKELKILNGGTDNYNFILISKKGKFIVRIIGHKIDKWKKERIKLKFKVLNYLNKTNFNYHIPKPLKNKKKKNIINLNSKNIWVYKYLAGKPIKLGEYNKKQIREVAKALAHYHKIIMRLKSKFEGEEKFRKWIREGLQEIKNSNSKNKITLIAQRYVNLFEEVLDKVGNKPFRQRILINHRDFHTENLLFDKKKLVAIIDFDDVDVRPRIADVAKTLAYVCFTKNNFDKNKTLFFLKIYEQTNKLSKKEKELIPYYILQEYCAKFRWIYDGFEGKENKKYLLIKKVINESKEIINSFNLDIK